MKTALVTDLPRDMGEIYGMEIAVEIKAVRYGSMIVFFGVLVAGLSALSRYKNLYDSIELISSQASTVIGALKQRFGEFSVGVSTVYPRLVSPYDRHLPVRYEMFLEEFGLPAQLQPRRDGFFYFLLSWGIIAFLIISALVYAAVHKTYFTP